MTEKVRPGRITDSVQLERYRLLVDSVQDYAIFLLDTDGHIASWNAGARRFKGYKEREIVGKHFSVFYTENDRSIGKPNRILTEAVQFGRIEDEGWRVRKDGTRFWANVVITALFDEDGVLQGFAKVTRDMTDRKAMEDELANANELLRRREKVLTELNRAKDEFIALTSHQLRTPATAVKQYLAMLLQGYVGDLSNEQRTFLQNAYDSNERQLAVIDDILRIARLDMGHMELNREPVDMVRFVRSVLKDQHDEFKKGQLNLAVDLPDQPVMAEVDEEQLYMALDNIVNNAIKYTAPHRTITVSLKNGPANMVRIDVTDQGVGIAHEDLAKLFLKFSRIPNPRSTLVGGTGLGLYWAKSLVELHHGHILVESEVGKGTTFTLELPRQ